MKNRNAVFAERMAFDCLRSLRLAMDPHRDAVTAKGYLIDARRQSRLALGHATAALRERYTTCNGPTAWQNGRH